MKTIVATLLLICAINFVIAQKTEKTIEMKELSKSDISIPDTNTVGHQAGDVSVTKRPASYNNKGDSEKDTRIIYTIHFIRPYKNELKNYSYLKVIYSDYDKASCFWIKRDIVQVALISSVTKTSESTIFFQPPERLGCCNLDIMQGAVDSFDVEWYIKNRKDK